MRGLTPLTYCLFGADLSRYYLEIMKSRALRFSRFIADICNRRPEGSECLYVSVVPLDCEPHQHQLEPIFTVVAVYKRGQHF